MARTVKQQAIGGGLLAIVGGGNLGVVVTALASLSTAQGPPALQAWSPKPYADFGTVNTRARASQLFMNLVGRQITGGRGVAVGTPKAVALAEARDVGCEDTTPRWLNWMHEFADTARPISTFFAVAPVSQFTVFGATPQRDIAVMLHSRRGIASRPPKWSKPQLTRFVDEAPTGNDLLHEIKYDGYRMHTRIDGREVSRTHLQFWGRHALVHGADAATRHANLRNYEVGMFSGGADA